MALARVVAFDGVSSEQMEEMRRRMEDEPRPDDVPATEIVVLHDPDTDTALVILFFDNDADYRRGDATLDAMPTEDTPGRRSSVSRYEVAFRTTT